MKKIIALIAIILVVAGIAAFILIANPFEKPEPTNPTGPTGPTSPTEPSNPTNPSGNTVPSAGPNDDPTQPTEPIVYEITEEAVRNHPVAPESDFTYRTEDGGIVITGYKGTDSIVVIPEKINDMMVTSISSTAFSMGCAPGVKGLLIPAGVTTLHQLTFENNWDLEVVVWDSVIHLGDYLFVNCGNLREVVLGDKLYTIGNYAFTFCGKLEKLYIQADVDLSSSIGVFDGCTNLIVYCPSDSAVESFCLEHGIPFVAQDSK